MHPVQNNKFWHGNFSENFYEGPDTVKVLFTGYSGAVVGQAIYEYASHYLSDDPLPEIYFVGGVYAFRDSALNVGDIVYARDTFSPNSFEQNVYDNTFDRGIENVSKPDPILLTKILKVAKAKTIKIKPAKVYCDIDFGYYPDFDDPKQLMNEAMWWKLSLTSIPKDGFNSGDYESAAALATSKLFEIPAVALMDVKYKRYSETDYKVATSEQKNKALNNILTILHDVLIE